MPSYNYKSTWKPLSCSPYLHSLLTSLLPSSVLNPCRLPALMTSELPTPSAKRLLKLVDLTLLLILLVSNTSTRWNLNAGLASAWLLIWTISKSRAADPHQHLIKAHLKIWGIYLGWGGWGGCLVDGIWVGLIWFELERYIVWAYRWYYSHHKRGCIKVMK